VTGSKIGVAAQVSGDASISFLLSRRDEAAAGAPQEAQKRWEKSDDRCCRGGKCHGNIFPPDEPAGPSDVMPLNAAVQRAANEVMLPPAARSPERSPKKLGNCLY
jgi:hypothetical protein